MEGPWDLSARYSSTGVQWTAQSWSSRLSHCYSSALSQWDVFFPTMRNKFKSQYSYYWSGMRHTCLISVPMVLESIADCVSCCVQNSHPFNKTVSTPVHSPRQSQLPIYQKKPPKLQTFWASLSQKRHIKFSAKLLLDPVTHFDQTFRIE